jgi:hypothetical protein
MAAGYLDVSLVLVLVTALEEMLEIALASKMRELPTKQYKRLFGGNGPLSTFWSRTEIAYALKIIGDDLIGDFRAIRDIRNGFAHPKIVSKLNSPHLREHLQRLPGWSETVDPRNLFRQRIGVCMAALNSYTDANEFAEGEPHPMQRAWISENIKRP